MAKGDFRKRTRLSQLAVEEKNRLKRGPSKYITKGRGKRVLNPKWTAWNKKKTDASDLKIRQKENEEEQRKYIREEKPDGTPTVRERTAVDSMDDIKKYSDSAYRKNQEETKKDPYTGKPEVTSENTADNAAKTRLNIGRDQQKTDVNPASKLKIKKGPKGKIGKIMGNKSLDSAAKIKKLNKLKKSSAMFQRGREANKLRLAQLRLGR